MKSCSMPYSGMDAKLLTASLYTFLMIIHLCMSKIKEKEKKKAKNLHNLLILITLDVVAVLINSFCVSDSQLSAL